MPLCPQITNTPITVVQNADFTVSSVLPVVAATTTQLAATNAEVAAANAAAAQAAADAAAAAAAAGVAQADAAAALVEAGLAFDASVNSLQKSADTIVNASNQITAINGTGITIYSGADSGSGSRVVLNSLGLAAYGSGPFAVTNAVGNGSTVTYTASGHNLAIGATVNVSGLAPAGYNGVFVVTAIVAGSTFTVSNSTTGVPSDPNGVVNGPSSTLNITNAVGNGTTVTYTATNHAFLVGTSIIVTGLAPAGYNGTFLITAVASGTTFTVANKTTATLTDPNGIAQAPTLAISASTGDAIFQGSVTGSSIIGGTLNISGNAIINSSGLLTATGATITGDIRATSGYFGTVSNGFSINSTGLVGVGGGVISGGTISGTTFTNGSTFSVTSAGALTATSGTIGGFTLDSGSLFSGNLTLNSSGTITGGNASTIFYGFANIGGGAATGARLIVAGNSELNGTISALGTISTNGGLNVDTSVTFGLTNTFQYLSSSGTLRSAFTYGNAVSGRSMQISSAGDFGTTASTLRKKHDVEPYAIDSSKLLQLQTKTFKYLPEIDDKQEQQYGFIAEEAEALGLLPLILYNEEGQVDYFAYEKLPIFLLQLAQEQEARIQALEGA